MNDEKEEFESLCTLIGFVVVNWALAEQSLDHLVETIYAQCGGECGGESFDKEIPRSFDRKVKFLRKAFRKSAPLQVFAEDGNKLLNRMVPLSKKRHDLVHGVVVSIEAVNGTFPIDKLDYVGQKNIMRRIEFNPQSIDALIGELLELGGDMARFGTALADRLI